jgi:ATP-binding cassette, subfamily B, bacterial PglK
MHPGSGARTSIGKSQEPSLLDTLRKISRLIGSQNRSRWVALVVLAIAASVIEMVGAALVYLLLAIIAEPGGNLQIPLLGDVRALFAGVDDTTFLLWVSGTIGVFFVFRAVAQVGITYTKQRMAQNAGARLSSRLMEGYLHLPYAFHLHRNSSELVRNAHTTVKEVATKGFLQAIYVVAEAAMILGLLVVMIAVTPAATALAVVIVGSAALLLLKIVQPKMKRMGKIAQEMEKRTLSAIQQSLHGVRDITVLGGQRYFGNAYRRSRLEQARALYTNGTIAELPRHIIETALFGFIIALFVISLLAGATTDELLATLGLFAYAGLRLMPSIQKLVGGLNNLKFVGAAVDHVYADLLLVEQHEPPRGPIVPLGFDDRLSLQDVSFTYDGTDRPALRDVDLEIRAGEVVGICGPTGGGKTTLTDLITGLLEPTTGRVLIDGEDLHGRTAAWFAHLGVVPQMVFLTDETLRHNIALGVEDDRIDEAALREAVTLAQLDEFVGSLPDGLDTVVGERGVRVSGGQRQRVAIARALYRRPDVLLFDEGTSALDNTTESVLMSSLERLRGRHTIVLVAHRLSTVRNCDKIVYLEHGRIAAIGTFDELRETNDSFRALARGV